MSRPPLRRPRAIDGFMVLFGLALLAVASPLRLSWAREGRPWYTPFVLWLAIIALAALAALRARREEP